MHQGVAGSLPEHCRFSFNIYIFVNGMHFQLTSLLLIILIMCMLFATKCISYVSVTIVLIPGFPTRLLIRSMLTQEY